MEKRREVSGLKSRQSFGNKSDSIFFYKNFASNFQICILVNIYLRNEESFLEHYRLIIMIGVIKSNTAQIAL